MDADKEIDRLYALPLAEFTAARNALAKELSGDERERVKTLRKPSAAAWALNQAVRRSPAGLKEFLVAGEELRAAHEALLGGGERGPVDEATRRERAAAATLVEEAERAAEGGGAGLGERVAGTLRAALADDEVRAELEAGRLTREREAAGLGPLMAGSGAAPAKRGGARKDRDRERKAAARTEAKEARERHKRAERRARDAGQTVASARERAEAAMETLERAQRDEEEARAALDEAAKELEAAERRLE
jgi:hypothetical protein